MVRLMRSVSRRDHDKNIVSGGCGQGCLSALRIANENCRPGVGMNFRPMQFVGEKTMSIARSSASSNLELTSAPTNPVP